MPKYFHYYFRVYSFFICIKALNVQLFNIRVSFRRLRRALVEEDKNKGKDFFQVFELNSWYYVFCQPFFAMKKSFESADLAK